MSEFKDMIDALIKGNAAGLKEQIQAALDQGVSANKILNEGLIAGMDIVGQRMESEDMFIPEVLRSAKTMGAAIEILKPLLTADETRAKGKIVIGTVKGDMHDIGKNLVSMMISSAGFDVTDLGVDVPPEKFVEAVNEKQADILCLSALLTTTRTMMKETIDKVVQSGLRDKVKIMVGGAPISNNFSEEIGADGYAPDAGSAMKMAKMLSAQA